jgi:hypothetical protein
MVEREHAKEVPMVRKGLFVFLASLLIAGLVACPGPEQVEQPPTPDAPDKPEMTEEQKMQFVKENCICKNCPSWTPACDENGEWGGYCASGKTECITDEKGCVCPECPVTEKMGLKWGYYCTRGSAKEMMAAEMEKEKPEGEGGE